MRVPCYGSCGTERGMSAISAGSCQNWEHLAYIIGSVTSRDPALICGVPQFSATQTIGLSSVPPGQPKMQIRNCRFHLQLTEFLLFVEEL